MPRAPRSTADFAQLPTEAAHPRAAKLDTMAPEAIAALMLGEEAKAVRAAAGARRRHRPGGRAWSPIELAAGGRLVYVGAGTSGRLGTLDAVECVPTFGVPPSRLVADHRRRAGGADPLRGGRRGQRPRRRAAHAARGGRPGRRRLLHRRVGRRRRSCAPRSSTRASGAPRPSSSRAPARRATNGERVADVVIALDTGPEVIAGSTRLKAGTATKIALNAMSTAAFVLLGKTYGGLMVDVRPTNAKLWARAIRIVRALSGLDERGGPQADREGGRPRQGRAGHAPRAA